MRSLFVLLPLLLAGCATSPELAPDIGKMNAARTTAFVEKLRLTLDIRYKMGETLALSTRVILLDGENLITTTLKECGVTPGTSYVAFMTGGIVQDGVPCRVLIAPPGEPAQVFELPKPKKSAKLDTWTPWQPPKTQILSPMPAQALLHQPKTQQKITVPLPRQFEVRTKLTIEKQLR